MAPSTNQLPVGTAQNQSQQPARTRHQHDRHHPSMQRRRPRYYHDGGLVQSDDDNDEDEDEDEEAVTNLPKAVSDKIRPPTPIETLNSLNQLAGFISHARTLIATTPTQEIALRDSLLVVINVLFGQVSDLLRIVVSSQQPRAPGDEQAKILDKNLGENLRIATELLHSPRKKGAQFNFEPPSATPQAAASQPAPLQLRTSSQTPQVLQTPPRHLQAQPQATASYSASPSQSQTPSTMPPEVLARMLGNTSIASPASVPAQQRQPAQRAPHHPAQPAPPVIPEISFLASLAEWIEQLAPRVKAATLMHMNGSPSVERLLLTKSQLESASASVKRVLPDFPDLTWELRKFFVHFQNAAYPGTAKLPTELEEVSDRLKVIMQMLGRVQIAYNRANRLELLTPVPQISEGYTALKKAQNLIGFSLQSHKLSWAVVTTKSMPAHTFYTFDMDMVCTTKMQLSDWLAGVEALSTIPLDEKNRKKNDLHYQQKHQIFISHGKLDDIMRIMTPVLRHLGL